MQRIVGALSSLTLMVALWAAFADDSQNVESDRLVSNKSVSLTPEQHEFANEFLDAFGWTLLQAIQPYVTFENPDADELVAGELSLEDEELAEFRVMLKPELLFVRKVCDLPEPEFRTLSQSCEALLTGIVPQFFAEQEQREQALNNGKNPSAELKQLPQRIREAVSQIAECQLTPEQWSQFSAEFQLRTAHRKRVAILNLVARLDHDLLLTSTQREQVRKLLEDIWSDSWSQSLGAFASESNFMPFLAEDDLRPILSPAQLDTWSHSGYDDDVSNFGDDSLEWIIDEDVDEVMVDEAAPADGNAPQEPKALGLDQ